MKLQELCKACLKNQIQRYLDECKLELKHKEEILSRVDSHINSFLPNHYLTPPEAAIGVYDILKTSLKVSDPYKEIKYKSMELARKISQNIVVNNLDEALKACVIGNVIDYGSQDGVLIMDAIHSTFKEEWGIYDITNFKNALNKAGDLLFIGDNAGENYFDEILIKFIKDNYAVKITYLTRGSPIINDLTLDDVKFHESLSKICDVDDSGVNSAGFIYSRANDRSKNYFTKADIILAKGMGNFECLEFLQDPRIFFLFKVKCDVVGRFMNIPKGKVVFMQRTPN